MLAAFSICRYPTFGNMIATAHPDWAHAMAKGYMNWNMLSWVASFGSGGTVFRYSCWRRTLGDSEKEVASTCITLFSAYYRKKLTQKDSFKLPSTV